MVLINTWVICNIYAPVISNYFNYKRRKIDRGNGWRPIPDKSFHTQIAQAQSQKKKKGNEVEVEIASNGTEKEEESEVWTREILEVLIHLD